MIIINGIMWVIAVAVAIVFCCRIKQKEKFPWYAVLIIIAASAGAIFLTKGFSTLLKPLMTNANLQEGTVRYELYDSFFVAAIPEEIAKFIAIWLLCRYLKQVTTVHDVVLVGVFVGAMYTQLENALYVLWENPIAMAGRCFMSGHVGYGALMAYLCAMHVKKKRQRGASGFPFFSLAGIVLPILIHGFFDVDGNVAQAEGLMWLYVLGLVVFLISEVLYVTAVVLLIKKRNVRTVIKD